MQSRMIMTAIPMKTVEALHKQKIKMKDNSCSRTVKPYSRNKMSFRQQQVLGVENFSQGERKGPTSAENVDIMIYTCITFSK